MRKEFRQRCIVGMRSIVQVKQKALKDEDTITLKARESLSQELSSERTRATRILEKIMHHWGISDAYAEMRRGSWRDAGPLEDLRGIDMS